ncbi:MAG TPA: class I SAM-dependent methyltransferase [Thermoanaerobaculia bacterium]|nr:class I SAM-dependent methyltransferase [Thermoanaerobaculia bacterium]
MNPLRRAYRGLLRLAQDGLARCGLNVALTRDYYSPLPVRRELLRHRERWNRPSALIGVDYDLDAMKALHRDLVERFYGEWRELPPYAECKKMGYGPGFTELDAMGLYMMLRHRRPRRFVEVGSGLSTWYAAQAIARNAAEGHPGELLAIDPWASEKVRSIAGLEVLRQPVQDAPFEVFEALGEGDVLFIDSTHVVKIDGDVPHLYLEVVPRLRQGVLVHAHDVHFPYNVPHPAEQYVVRRKWGWYWTEAMLLQAFLAFNREFEMVLSLPLLRYFDEEFLRSSTPGYRGVEVEDHDSHFGSIWFGRRAPSGARSTQRAGR